ncbi:hypothetical protein ROJ8625_02084 [Roseivivax jejudonensis]|uniref:Uncharacterized protein n=1 Tax=Roseivivax jejudonensis TaxID=1529041 RepID=A0A1X6Z7H2_9RHOB|nr:hypothetical protein [Roseivivax jejudonensis]SLN42593.1 hypothetical protein ROJ8625_02084 [Roseivivax jejudonensis]
MSDLRGAILDAKYVDMIELADFVVRDCGLPDMDENGEMLPQQNEIAAAVFRWAAGAELASRRVARSADTRDEYDEFGDPIIDVAEAETHHKAHGHSTSEDAQ